MSALPLSVFILACVARAEDPARLAAQEAELARMAITADRLMPLALDTDLVTGGRPVAVICHADSPAWRRAATVIRDAIAEVTGVTLDMMTDAQFELAKLAPCNIILLGHLDNNRVSARLYHNFFDCLDVGYTGRKGYELRSVHNPWGDGRNYLIVGGSYPEGTERAAEAFAALMKQRGQRGELRLGRLLELQFDKTDRSEPIRDPVTDADRDQAIADGRRLMFSPGQGRSGISRLVSWGTQYHRTGDPNALAVYRELMLALLEYHRTDPYIQAEGMARYDRDFRDSWTYTVGILWDLIEESGAFSDAERLACTNHIMRLAMECVKYQGYDRPEIFQQWLTNANIVHNHNTFPALGIHFVGQYFKRHYGLKQADDWLAVARGIFNGQKRSSKPLEDAAGYQWLPILHTMTYSLAEGDLTFFEEGHAKETAKVAMMVMDNAGYQGAFGDHEALKAASAVGQTLQRIAWYYKSPEYLWGAQRAALDDSRTLGQGYCVDFAPRPPADLVGLAVSRLPRICYDACPRHPTYPVAPNLPWEQTFDKLTFRDGLEREDAYLLLDGFGRGTHLHFDPNAIISFAAGGEPLLVDGEYIKNAPKYHNSLVILRDGKSELAPAVAGLGCAAGLDATSYSRSYLTEYNGAEWQRAILWRRGEYFVVSDQVRALEQGDFTLRCCWRPWGYARLEGGIAMVDHDPMLLTIANVDGAPCRLETLKTVDLLPISRLSQQISQALKPQETYRFLNLIRAERADRAKAVTVRRVREATVVVERQGGADVVCFAPQREPLSGLQCRGEMLLLAPERLATAGCTLLSDGADILRSSVPVSVELSPAEGRGVLVAEQEAEVSLRLQRRVQVRVGERELTVDGEGVVRLQVSPGRTAISFDAFPSWPGVVAAHQAAAALPTLPSPQLELPGSATVPLRVLWSAGGLKAPPQLLRIARAQCDQPYHTRYGPFEKLYDGAFSSSTHSVMWPLGVKATVTLTLMEETDITQVVLREWHMNSAWDVGSRALEISSDGFEEDIRTVPGAFREVGTQRWGSNVNTLMAVPVGQRARQLRLTLTPAREDSSVYVAEVEVHGTIPGQASKLLALASGDLNGDGAAEAVVASDSGEVAAFGAGGQLLWTFATGENEPVNAVACADLDGDRRAEIIYGGGGSRLGLLSGEGKERWHVELPQYRGIPAEVINVLAADVSGDGRPEVICGCRSWMYFAFDADGNKLWGHVIYAHSATVSHADDFDGDGRQEIIAGNAYYSLNVIDDNGKGLFRGRRSFGPEQTAVCSADVDADGKPEVLIGTDGGDLYCFDGDGSVLWVANLGDKVTRVVPVDLNGDGGLELACAAESACVFALNLAGKELWRAALGDGVSDLLVLPGRQPTLVAAAGSGGVVMLDAQGKRLAAGELAGSAQGLALGAGRVFVTTDAGKVWAVDVSGVR